MVIATAMPNAEARLSDERKVIAKARVCSISAQLTNLT